MPASQLLDREVIVAPVLRTVGQGCPVRSNRAGDPAIVPVIETRPCLLGELYAAADQLLGFGLADSRLSEPADRGLI
jgi:hypothetical protein